MAVKTKHSRYPTAGFLVRCTPLLSLLIPFLASISLLCTQSVVAYGSVLSYISTHRTTVSIFVQLLSSIMGILQITTITTIINHATRLRLAGTSMRLDTARLLTALPVPRMPWTLSTVPLLLAIGMVTFAQVPGALCAGAITPVAVQGSQQVGSIAVPQFTAETQGLWDAEFEIRDGDVWNLVDHCITARGEVTYVSNCPVPNQQRALLEPARSVSTGMSVLQNHSKPENPTWAYRGRSYGVGSAQGLREVMNIPAEYNLLGYTYKETGYEANVSCIRNASAALRFLNYTQAGNVDVLYFEGSLPNSRKVEFYPVLNWHRETLDEAALLAWAGVSNPYIGSEHMIGLVASKKYDKFQNLQCDITFSPRTFSIVVNRTMQTIVASPMSDSNTFDPESTGHLQRNAVYSLNLLSRMSTSLYVSVLGEALGYNLQTLTNSSDTATDSNETMIFQSVEESFVAMFDNALGIYGGAQLVLSNNGSVNVPIDGIYTAMHFGQESYQWAVLVVNGALLVVFLAEAIRTRWWRGERSPYGSHALYADCILPHL